MELARAIYRVTASFPKDETFGLTSQIRRAVVSVPCNIAEGSGRRHPKEFAQLLSIAVGSLRETETLWQLSKDFELSDPSPEIDELLDKAGRMLNRLRSSTLWRSEEIPRRTKDDGLRTN